MEHVHIDFRDQINSNKLKSVLLIICIVGVFAVLGGIIGMIYDSSLFFVIMSISIVVSIIYTWFGYYNSDKIALSSVRARPASRQEFSDYYRLVESLTF